MTSQGRPQESLIQNWAAKGAICAGAVGAIVGLIVGLFAHAPTAWADDVRGRHPGIRAGRAPRRNQRRRRDGASPRSGITPSRPSPRAEARRRGRRRLCSPAGTCRRRSRPVTRVRGATISLPGRNPSSSPTRSGTRSDHFVPMVTTRRLIACDRVPARRRRRQPELPGGGCVRCRLRSSDANTARRTSRRRRPVQGAERRSRRPRA